MLVCNYLHSHFRQLKRPRCFLMEQRRGPELVERHSLSRDFWDVQPDASTPQNQICGVGPAETDGLSLYCDCHTSVICISREITRAGIVEMKRGVTGEGVFGKSNGFCFVVFWWTFPALCSLKLLCHFGLVNQTEWSWHSIYHNDSVHQFTQLICMFKIMYRVFHSCSAIWVCM